MSRYLFLTTGTYGSSGDGQRPLHQSTWNIVNRAINRVGTEISTKHKRGPHAIRHAYATKLLDNGEPIKNIADLLGHTSIETTFIYTKSSMKRLRPLTKKWPSRRSHA